MKIKLFCSSCTFCGGFVVLPDPIFTLCYVHTLRKYFFYTDTELGHANFYSGTLAKLMPREACKSTRNFVLPLLDPCQGHENHRCPAWYRMKDFVNWHQVVGPTRFGFPAFSLCDWRRWQNHSPNLWAHKMSLIIKVLGQTMFPPYSFKIKFYHMFDLASYFLFLFCFEFLLHALISNGCFLDVIHSGNPNSHASGFEYCIWSQWFFPFF